jgi:hypothetical protein
MHIGLKLMVPQASSRFYCRLAQQDVQWVLLVDLMILLKLKANHENAEFTFLQLVVKKSKRSYG